MKSVQIPSVQIFGPNTGKYGTEKSPYLDNFHAVLKTLKPNESPGYDNIFTKKLQTNISSSVLF